MASVLQVKDNRESLLAWLSPCGFSSPNHEWFSCMLASWYNGQGVLPDYLGLQSAEFHTLQQHFFPHCALSHRAPSSIQFDDSRMLEKDDLIQLLKQHRRDDNPETDWVIAVLVAACLGNDHLWQDLGLWSRMQLSALLAYNFPDLAAKNTKDMKWKKFIYKQLCEAEGIYICRAPSCEVCIDYPKCFGPER